MRQLVAIVLDQSGDFARIQAKYFDGKKGLEIARGKLLDPRGLGQNSDQVLTPGRWPH
jgi:hypothetical protein